MKYYRDLKNSLDTAEGEGYDRGLEEGIEKVARNLLANNVSIEVVIKSTGLTKEQFETLK